jgi:subtilisin family serine protease
MASRDLAASTATVVLLSLVVAGCGGEPTGWIPRDGSIAGIVSVSGVSFVPPASAGTMLSATQANGLAFPVPRRLLAVAPSLHPRTRGTLLRRVPRPATTSNELIVSFRGTALGAPPLGSAALRTAARAGAFGRVMRAHLAAAMPAGAQVAGVSPAILTARIRVADATLRDAVAAALRHDPQISGVTPNRLIWLDQGPFYKSRLSAAGTGLTPNNPLYPYQSWHYGLVDLPRAWAISTGSVGVLVAVVDDGIRFDHPAIAANLTHDGYDFVNNVDSLPLCAGGQISNSGDGDGYDPDPTMPSAYRLDSTGTCFFPDTIANHGLHVAGTIGAVGNSGIGVTGVNWKVQIRPVRVLGVGGFGTSYDVAQGVLYAAGLPADDGNGGTVQPSTGARIINLSLGGPANDTTLARAVASAVQAGALIVAAAGNDSSSIASYPAAYPGVLAVAAVGPDGAPAPYSNFGSYVALSAPGGNFGLGDATDGVMSTIWDFGTNTPEYAWAEGTSMATPHVSGIAALVLSQAPSLTAADLRSRLSTYAVGPASNYGAGLVNAYNSLTSRHGPPTQLYARLYAANTGAMSQTVAAGADGHFQFAAVEDGQYFVYAGSDENQDHTIGTPGRWWGAYGGPQNPIRVTAFGGGPSSIGFSIYYPSVVANHDPTSAGTLVIGGYLQGRIADPNTLDVYLVPIPAVGTYAFETAGWVGACGIALEEATAIGLYDHNGQLLTYTGFIDPQNLNYCSRLTLNLNPGSYFVGVAGAFGHRYRLQARAGS